jgi:GT2 family glycosyltransferase
MKKVSLILLVKRIDPALKSSINSVLNQDYSDQHIQIILLLGNPVPGLNQLLKEITKPTSNIEILKIDGLSEIEAINKAVMESQGDYFILINPRICYPNNYISHSIELIEKHHADNIGAKWKVISSGNSLVKESIAILLGSNFVIGNTPYKVKTSKTTITSQLFNACYRKRSP